MTSRPPRRSGLFVLLLGWLVLTSGCAMFRPPASEVAAAPAGPPALELIVEAPAPLKALLGQHLDLARLAALRDETLDETEWARLVAATPQQARELAQTEGYFEAQVQVRREAGQPPRVRVQLEPGPRSTVASRVLQFDGPLAERLVRREPEAQALQQALETTGPLRPGSPFRNSDWSDTKQQLVARLRASGHALATVSQSQAEVDVPTRSARLSVTLDSGPLFLAGPVRIEGLQHHDEATARRLADFNPGVPLTEALLLDYQERLQKSGLFETVSVSFDPDLADAASTPVQVRLRELPLQQATAALGHSDSTGPRASIEHTHRRPFGRPLTAYHKLQWGRDAQTFTSDIATHPGPDFSRRLLGAQVERVRGDQDIVLSQRLRLGLSTESPQVERLSFVEWLRSRQSLDSGGVVDARALSLQQHLVLRRLDSVLLPTQGYSLALQYGGGQARSNTGQSGPFGRLYGRATLYWPLGLQWYGSARAEVGQVIKRDAVVIPDALGFRAGGDDSVRGYGYRELAPQRDGHIVSGNVLATGSVELARPLLERLPSVWGAVFVDAGRAAERWQDFKPALGYGVGLRWRSPIGPLRADLAYGQDLRKVRLHLSVGVNF